jgi:hypothetical protein
LARVELLEFLELPVFLVREPVLVRELAFFVRDDPFERPFVFARDVRARAFDEPELLAVLVLDLAWAMPALLLVRFLRRTSSTRSVAYKPAGGKSLAACKESFRAHSVIEDAVAGKPVREP